MARIRNVCLALAALIAVSSCVPGNPIDVTITSPAHGDFSTASSILVTGTTTRNAAVFQLAVNGVAVPIQPDKTWSTTISLNPSEVFNPVYAVLTRTSDGATWTDRIVVIAGDSVADGAFSDQSIALRINDSGLDEVEPLVASLAGGSLDIETILVANNPVATTVVCIIPNPFGGCLVDVTVEVFARDVTNSSPGGPGIANFASFALDVDAMTNFAAGDITINNLYVEYDSDGVDCKGVIHDTVTDIVGDYELKPDAVDPSNIDVNLIGAIDVQFTSFQNTIVGGVCDFPVIGDIIQLIIGNVQPLVEQGFEDGLSDPDGSGPLDSPIAEGIETALAGVELSGPIGESLGVSLETPLFDVFEDVDGITLDSNSRITAAMPDPTAPDFTASYHVPETFPTFGATTPVGGLPYELGLCISTSAFNQLLKAEVESGLLATDLTQIDIGFGLQTITSTSLAVVLPAFGLNLPPDTPLILRIQPTLAPVVTGNVGPASELAEMRLGQLQIDALTVGPPEQLQLSVALDFVTGLDFSFDNLTGELVPALSAPLPSNITSVILDNPIGENPLFVELVLPSFIAPILPTLGDSLGSFPLPDFLGLSLSGVEVSRQGQFMSVFLDLTPVP